MEAGRLAAEFARAAAPMPKRAMLKLIRAEELADA
jgi:hypothetical protein